MAAHAQDIARLPRHRVALRASTHVYALCALGIIALWPTFHALASFWHSSHDYGHGYLVAAVSVAWLLRSRRRLDSVPVRPMPVALGALTLAVLTWAVAYRGNSQIGQQLLAPAILLLAVLAATGRHVALRAAAPLLYLYFAIPLWDQLVPLLQAATTDVAEGTLRLFGVPATVESHVVTIPEGRFAIVEGCAGKRYFIVALAFAVLVAATHGLRGARTAVVIAGAAGLALIANWLRVITIIYAGHATNMEHYLVASEHTTFGTLLFVPLLAAIVLIAHVASRKAPRAHAVEETPAGSAGHTALWLAGACLCVPILVVSTTPRDSLEPPRLSHLPVLTGDWQGPLPPETAWRPQFPHASDEVRVAYASSGGSVQLYMNVYGAQSQGSELISYENSVVPTQSWTILQELPSEDGVGVVIAADAAAQRWVIATAYAVRGRLTDVGLLAQAYYAMYSMVRPVASGAIAVGAACDTDCTHAAARVQRFWRQHGAALVKVIPAKL